MRTFAVMIALATLFAGCDRIVDLDTPREIVGDAPDMQPDVRDVPPDAGGVPIDADSGPIADAPDDAVPPDAPPPFDGGLVTDAPL